MPEGDSIHRLAARLRPRLVGGRVRSFDAHDIADAVAKTIVGREVVAVEARGKNLLVRFDDGRALHVHLRMLGRLGFERPRSAFWKPRTTSHQLRLDVELPLSTAPQRSLRGHRLERHAAMDRRHGDHPRTGQSPRAADRLQVRGDRRGRQRRTVPWLDVASH